MIEIFFYEKGKYLLLGFYLLISVSFMITRSEKVNINIKSGVNTVIYPFHYTINSLAKTVDSFWVSIEELNMMKRELLITKNQLEKLKSASFEIQELKRENERLRTILDIKTRIEYKTVFAEIIARDPSNNYSVFVINKGSRHGLERNMPVISYQQGLEGIVGKTIEVSRGSAKILPVTGLGSYTGCMHAALRNIGLIRGQGPTEEYLLFDYLDKNAQVGFGDLVVTSGQGGIFPKGLMIGKIVGFTKVKYGIFYKDVRVKPILDFSMLEDVYVILKPADEEIVKFEKGMY